MLSRVPRELTSMSFAPVLLTASSLALKSMPLNVLASLFATGALLAANLKSGLIASAHTEMYSTSTLNSHVPRLSIVIVLVKSLTARLLVVPCSYLAFRVTENVPSPVQKLYRLH